MKTHPLSDTNSETDNVPASVWMFSRLEVLAHHGESLDEFECTSIEEVEVQKFAGAFQKDFRRGFAARRGDGGGELATKCEDEIEDATE